MARSHTFPFLAALLVGLAAATPAHVDASSRPDCLTAIEVPSGPHSLDARLLASPDLHLAIHATHLTSAGLELTAPSLLTRTPDLAPPSHRSVDAVSATAPRGPPQSYPETRIWALDLSHASHIAEERFVCGCGLWGCADCWCGVASDSHQALLVHNAPKCGKAAAAPSTDGVIYLRRDLSGTVGEYVGQAKSDFRYLRRQAEHQKAHPSANFVFEELGRAKPGIALDVLEEDWIRAGLGPTTKTKTGGLSNSRHQMNEKRYRKAGGKI